MEEKNNKKKIIGTDLGVIFSIIGIIASLILIIFNFINDESKTIAIVLLCGCSASLCVNARNKKNEK